MDVKERKDHMIHHYREKLLNYQKKINTFFSEYPFISLERIILLIVALFLHVRLNNRFTTCFAIVAFLVLFLQQILVGLSFLLDLFSLIYAWGKNNYEDIKHLLSYLFFELAAFILIFVTSLIILGLNSVAYEFIEIHQDFFVPYLKHYGIDEIAVTAKAIYSLDMEFYLQ